MDDPDRRRTDRRSEFVRLALLRHRTVLFVVSAITLLLAAPAAAQEPPVPRDAADALARVPPGATLRIRTVAGDVFEGTFSLRGDSLVLEGDAVMRTVAVVDVRSAWLRQRETRRVSTTAAIIGGAAGGAWLGLLGLVAGGTAGETAQFAAIGVLGGAAAGGLLGVVVGAAVPRWTLVYPVGPMDATGRAARPPPVPNREETRAGRRRIGAFEGALGYGRIGGDEPTSGGPGARAGLHAEFGAEPEPGRRAAFVSVGPEVSGFMLGSTERIRRDFPPADTLELSRRYRAYTAGGIVRGGLSATATTAHDGVVRGWRGYGLLGLSFHRWSIEDRDERWISQSPDGPTFRPGQTTFEHIGYTAGAGVQSTLAPRTALGIELRRTAVGTFDMDLPGSYWTLSLTGARRW